MCLEYDYYRNYFICAMNPIRKYYVVTVVIAVVTILVLFNVV